MTRDDARMLEEAIAAVVRHIRATELEPLRRRLDAVEKDLAAYEALAGAADLKGDNVTWLKRGAR